MSKQVVKSDNSLGVVFPTAPEAKIHRVAVALGGHRKVGLPFGDFGKGFVHVLDEISFLTLLNELNTITDFVNYLSAKERFFKSGVKAIFEGQEEDLLAFYLYKGRKFPDNYDAILISDGLWEQVQSKQEYARKQEADKDSLIWDKIIEEFCEGALKNELEFSSSLTNTERSVRTIARETRFARRILGKAFKEFLDASMKVRSRKLKSPSGIVYVFLAMPHGVDRKFRVAELSNRCFVARGLQTEATVVGLATEQYVKGQGHSLDLCHLYLPVWSTAQQKRLEQMQKELGYFTDPLVTKDSEDEYPQK